MLTKTQTQTAIDRVLNAKGPRTKWGKFAARFGANERGVAAIEFALIAPILLFIYFGLCEISLLIESDRNVSQAASVMGDLAAQDPVASPQMVSNYISAAIAIMDANQAETNRMSVEIYSFEAFDQVAGTGGTPVRAVRSVGRAKFDGGSAPGWSADFDPANIEERLLAIGSGIIVARVSYEYDSPLSFFVQDTDLRETFMLKPRVSNIVQFDNGSSNADETQRYNMGCTLASGSGGIMAVNCTPAAPD